DFGDAPDTYQTTLASDGARHIAGSGLDFGTPADRETDGQPSAGAVGDDTDTDGDDEGGVTIPHLRQGHDATVTVDATAAGFVDGFIDYNADGDFADAGEKVVNSIAVTAGSNDLTFPVPASIPGATTYARFRISSAGGLGYDGFAADGEVEDHQVQIGLSMTGGPLTPGINTFVIQNGTPGCLVNLAVGTTPGSAFLPDYGITLGIADPVIVGQGLIGPTGESIIQFTIPAGFSGTDLLFQSFEHGDNNPQLSNVMTVSVPLLAVGGEGPGAAAITQAEVDALLPVARQQWEATGLTAQQQARLEAATVELADVPDARLGQTADTTIFIDDTAAGYGWFVDVTPNSDSEFSFTGTNQLSAANGSTAFGKHDLLTVLVHELGHVLGREHAAEDPQDVMAEMLPTGTRRLTDGAEANFDFSGQIEFNQNAGGEFDIVITGTPDSDAFEFVAGEQHHLVSLNGEQLHLASDAVSSIDFRGAGGEDSALLTGSSGDDMVRLYPHRAVLTAADFEVNLREMGSIEVLAGEGVDRASMYDSIGNDQFYGRPEFSRLVGDGFENKATGFDSVFVYASAGGDSDFAYLYDDFSSDRLIARPGLARLFGDSFFNEVRFFDRVYAYATAGGEPDYAYLYDSIGDDVLIARPEHTRMTGDGFFNDARDFDRVYAYATAGGEADMAYMYDSIGNDKFFGKPEFSRLQGDGFFNDAWSFDSVYAYATAGGTADYAYLYDSPGADDFIGRPEYAQLSGDEFFNKVHSFDRVYAHATAGGEDHAYQYDSTGNDRYIGRPGSALMYGDDFFNDARHFERVNAYASAGGSDDRATMTKIESADSLFGRDNFGMLTGPDRYERIFHFDSLRAYAKDGHTGHADVSGVDYFFQQIGDWE
ncbi:MAG: GEVED domain-containing protein, partial [Pirellulales bacterium]